jgi:rRNA-processing protein FCF1
MLKAFESKELEKVIENKTFVIRCVLGEFKDIFKYAQEKPEYLDSKNVERCHKDCQKALESLEQLTKYLRGEES